jgi:2-polyprenyl-3-methyl-5-hydroxy-6-metoxy-1,4-benzoquinol methylase
MCTTLPDAPAGSPFAERLAGVFNDAALALMISVGHRTRLFDVMSSLPPATSPEIAKAAGLSERYVREWLGAMVTGGVVDFDPEAATYALPAEHAAWLTRAARPANLAVTAQFIAVLGAAEDRVVEAFRHGRGVPYSAYPRFHEVMAEESDQTAVAALEEHILPLVPDLIERLRAGIDVLDVGCGSGRAIIRLAELFPASRFAGHDFSDEAVGAARAEAARRRLANVRFEARDAAAPFGVAAFDAVFAFDAIHDQARPDAVLRNVARALRPGGVFLMQDIAASSHLHQNVGHPLAPFIYTISCMHCMSVSLAGNGAGLGAAWGRELAQRMLRDAGFGDVRVQSLPHDPLNDYYVSRVR